GDGAVREARGGRESRHGTRGPKRGVRNDGEIVRFLLGNNVPDSFILRSAELFIARFASPKFGKNFLQLSGAEQAADLVDTQRIEIWRHRQLGFPFTSQCKSVCTLPITSVPQTTRPDLLQVGLC